MTLEVKQLALSLNGKKLINNLNFRVEPGQIQVITGPSGCGKSSILDYLCGTLAEAFSASGEIFVDGEPVEGKLAHQRGIGLQLQDHLLFPHMTVAENLAFGLSARYRKKERHDKVLEALADCAMEGMEHQDPSTLSGGQKARVSLMRVLLSEPRALLLDEPFSKLDPELRELFRTFVFAQVGQRAIPTVMVTHDHHDIPPGASVTRLDFKEMC